MENASKALIMAGGIFLAIALITLFAYTYSNVHNLSKMQDEKLETQQLADFNKSYEAYNKSLLYGTELITVMNKASENNSIYENNTNYCVVIEFKFKETTVYVYEAAEGKRKESQTKFLSNETYGIEEYQNEIKETEAFDDFKRRIFKCAGVKYNSRTGRINYMLFEEVKLNDYEHR